MVIFVLCAILVIVTAVLSVKLIILSKENQYIRNMRNEYVEKIQEDKISELLKLTKDAETYMKENQLLHSENQVAAKIQKSMMPQSGLLDEQIHFQIYGDIDFAKEVGGDYYDYFSIDEKRVCISVGDVSGKGVPAVIYMVAAKLLLKKELQSGNNLSDAFEIVNKELFYLADERQFVTNFSIVFDIETGKGQYINAGHTQSILVKKDGAIHLMRQVSGLPLGSYYSVKKMTLTKYKVQEFCFEPGDLLIIYTDGCTEAMNACGELLGIERLKQIITDSHDMDVLDEQMRFIQRQIIAFENHEEQDDDYTIVGIKWIG